MTHTAGNLKDYPMFPETPAAAAALSVATRFHSPALLNHSVRCYLWAKMYGTAHGIAFDDELFYVAAMLHDIGLTEAFDNQTLPFEVAGGHVAWTVGVAAGWPEERAARAEEIITLHVRADVSAADDPESHLLQVATSWEVLGRRSEEFPPDARTEMLGRYPWLGFGAEVLANFEDQARRKPESAAAAAVGERGMAGRVAANPLESHTPA
jgi:HD domain